MITEVVWWRGRSAVAAFVQFVPSLRRTIGLRVWFILPPQADEHGRRGYMEWGFLSTTSNRAVAMQVGS